jgi:hypothetical protein
LGLIGAKAYYEPVDVVEVGGQQLLQTRTEDFFDPFDGFRVDCVELVFSECGFGFILLIVIVINFLDGLRFDWIPAVT